MSRIPQPIKNNIIVKQHKEAPQGRVALIVVGRELSPGQFVEAKVIKPNLATVVAIPSTKKFEDYWLKPNDRVYISKGSGIEVIVDGVEYLIVTEDVILGAD